MTSILQMGFPKLPDASVSCAGNVAPTLYDLSEDLRALFEKQVNHDMVLQVGDRAIKCHRAILSARSKWFQFRIEQGCVDAATAVIVDESEATMHALLLYLYTGNLRLVERLQVPILDLHEAAGKYGVNRLRKLLTRMLQGELRSRPKTSREFLWKLPLAECKSRISVLALEGFGVDGSDHWSLKIRPLCFSKVKYAFWLYVRRRCSERRRDIIHVATLEVNIVESSGRVRRSFVSEHVFRDDGESKMAEHISLCKLLEQPDALLPDGVLTLSGRLSVSAEDVTAQRMPFEIRAEHEGGVTNEIHALSYDMHKLMQSGQYSDVSFLIKGAVTFYARVHSYIMHGRSLIPVHYIGSLIEHGLEGSLLWKAFVAFVYTGQPRYLDDHMRQLYAVVSKLQLRTRFKYSAILASHLSESNVFDVVHEAILHDDTELVYAGLYFMAHRDILDHPKWVEFVNNHPAWAREIMKITRRKRAKLDEDSCD